MHVLATRSMDGRRFTIRAVMALIAGMALSLAWVRSQGSFLGALYVVSQSTVARGLCLVIAIAVTRAFGPAVGGRTMRGLVLAVLAVALTAALYLDWGRYRATSLYIFGLNHDYPYPDRAINALERWFDARRPVPPGFFKYHGEYPSVGVVFGLLALAFTGLSGALCGVLSKRPAGWDHVPNQLGLRDEESQQGKETST